MSADGISSTRAKLRFLRLYLTERLRDKIYGPYRIDKAIGSSGRSYRGFPRHCEDPLQWLHTLMDHHRSEPWIVCRFRYHDQVGYCAVDREAHYQGFGPCAPYVVLKCVLRSPGGGLLAATDFAQGIAMGMKGKQCSANILARLIQEAARHGWVKGLETEKTGPFCCACASGQEVYAPEPDSSNHVRVADAYMRLWYLDETRLYTNGTLSSLSTPVPRVGCDRLVDKHKVVLTL